jgi:hypothetical protein
MDLFNILHHLPETFNNFVFFFKIKKVKYIARLTTKKIIQDLCTVNRLWIKKFEIISRKKKVAAIDKYVENSRLRTVLNENGKSGFLQFLNRGIIRGVSPAHSRNCSANFLLKNSSSVKIILS